MSQPSNKPPPSGLAESQAYAIIRFRVQKPNGSFSHHEADCLISSVIHGLKDDLKRQLGPPESQEWFYKGKLMSNDHKLRDYEINGDGDEDINIDVKPVQV